MIEGFLDLAPCIGFSLNVTVITAVHEVRTGVVSPAYGARRMGWLKGCHRDYSWLVVIGFAISLIVNGRVLYWCQLKIFHFVLQWSQ